MKVHSYGHYALAPKGIYLVWDEHNCKVDVCNDFYKNADGTRRLPRTWHFVDTGNGQ
jgi:hypothetical protein